MIPTVAGRSAKTKHVAPPSTNNPEEWVYIVSSALNSLPSPGDRIDPADESNMPTVQANTSYPALQAQAGASKYRFVGIKFQGPSTVLQNAIVKIGGGEATVNDFPSDFIFDRCIIAGDSTNGARRGLALDAIRGAVVDSYIHQIWESSVDSIAVWAYNTPGPIKVVNNYCESGSENIMFGGATPSINNGGFPSDIEVRKNYCYKPLAWEPLGSARYVKNLMEIKYGRRVLIEGNVFQNNWYSAQAGIAFLLTPRNEVGTSNWVYISDITLRKNKFLNVGGGLNFAGLDTNWYADGTKQVAATTRVDVSDNLVECANLFGSDDQKGLQYIGGAHNVWAINNTIVITDAGGMAVICDQASYNGDGCVWRNNLWSAGSYGFYSASGEGTVTLNSQFDNWTYEYNVMIGSSNTGSYPAANNQFPANNTAVGFTDFAGGDYSLTVGSTYHNDGSDGTDPGADFPALNAATLYTVTGQWGSEDGLYENADDLTGNASLPQSYVDSSFVNLPTSGTTHVCTTSAQFTTALANCVSGDVIQLAAATTFQHATASFTARAR